MAGEILCRAEQGRAGGQGQVAAVGMLHRTRGTSTWQGRVAQVCGLSIMLHMFLPARAMEECCTDQERQKHEVGMLRLMPLPI